MTDSLGVLPVVNANSVSVNMGALQTTINGVAAVVPYTGFWQNGAPVGAANPINTYSVANIPPLNYTISSSAVVNTSSGVLISGGVATSTLTITTDVNGTSNIWLNPTGGTAIIGSGIVVFGGGGSFTFGSEQYPLPVAAITAITEGSSSQNVALAGG